MADKHVRLEVREQIAWVIFQREQKLNALNLSLLAELDQIIGQCEANAHIRVVALRGSDKAFMAGADIEQMAKGDINDAHCFSRAVNRVQNRIAALGKPTIAAISGYALGAGCEMSLCCDFRIAAENAMLGLPEINLGIIPGGGGTQRLPRLIGMAGAMRLVLSGEIIPAARALELGLLDQVVSLDELDSTVTGFGQSLAQKSAIALRAAKQALCQGMNMSLHDGLLYEQDLFAMLFGSNDQKEGMAAFLQKRKPQFTGN